MDKISGILPTTSRPVFTSSEVARPKRMSEPMPDDKERMEALRPPKFYISKGIGELEEGSTLGFSRPSMLDIKV